MLTLKNLKIIKTYSCFNTQWESSVLVDHSEHFEMFMAKKFSTQYFFIWIHYFLSWYRESYHKSLSSNYLPVHITQPRSTQLFQHHTFGFAGEIALTCVMSTSLNFRGNWSTVFEGSVRHFHNSWIFLSFSSSNPGGKKIKIKLISGAYIDKKYDQLIDLKSIYLPKKHMCAYRKAWPNILACLFLINFVCLLD